MCVGVSVVVGTCPAHPHHPALPRGRAPPLPPAPPPAPVYACDTATGNCNHRPATPLNCPPALCACAPAVAPVFAPRSPAPATPPSP
eukprot:gene14906-53431_t